MQAKQLTKIAKLCFFSKEALRTLEENEDSLNFNLKYWQKKGLIIPLKKGLYILFASLPIFLASM